MILGRRELMAYAFTFTTCIGFAFGLVESKQFMMLVSAVVAYYFGQRGSGK